MQKFPDEAIANIRRSLEEEKKRIMTQIGELSSQDPFADPERTNDNAASDAEASEESSHDRVAALLAALGKQREEIDNALMRLSSGQYGFCLVCGQMIDTDRLAVIPTATLCLSCQSQKKK